MIEGKIIWTLKELEELGRVLELGELPFARISVDRGTKVQVHETSKVNGHIKHIVVYLPSGVFDLVWVSIFLNEVPLVREVWGDNQYHSILAADLIKEGDFVLVTVSNNDVEWRHTVALRIEVEEEK